MPHYGKNASRFWLTGELPENWDELTVEDLLGMEQIMQKRVNQHAEWKLKGMSTWNQDVLQLLLETLNHIKAQKLKRGIHDEETPAV